MNTGPTADPIAEGNVGLDRGDWAAAKAAFESALTLDETPEALDGLGQALWWLNDLHGAIELWERAYAEFRAQGDLRGAGRIAARLGREYFTVHGNFAAASGWLQRAEHLLQEAGRCPEQGWLTLMKAFVAEDPAVRQLLANEAIELAKSLGDTDLEVVGVSALGLGLVYGGRVREGMERIDEAMAAATGGEVRSMLAISDIYCNTLLACERAGDFERAEQWCRVITEFARRRDCRPMVPFCHVTSGALLTATGRWGEAEAELELAVRTFDAGHRAMRVLALGRLADLRLRQGRIEEAEQLLAGYEDHPLALRYLVRLHLALGRVGLAVSVLRRRLGQLEHETLLAAPLLVLLVDAQLEQGDTSGAGASAERLGQLAAQSGQEWLEAEAAIATGRVGLARGDLDAVADLERALDLFTKLELPWDAARARLAVARARSGSEPEVALAEARLAFGAFERLGASRDADEAARVLRELGAGTPPGPKGFGILTRREAEVLDLVGEGLSNADISARLFISARTVEHHVGRILAKLNLKTRPQMVAYAMRRAADNSGQR